MTRTIVALTADRGRLIVKEARITNDNETAKLVRDMWQAQGFAVVERTED